MKQTGIPTFDITALHSGSMREQARVVLDIGAAARDVGYFAIVNHGVATRLREDAFAAARQFFAQPSAEKERVSMENAPYGRGYSRLGAERLVPGLPGDFKEAFTTGRDIDAAPNQWPSLAGFREATQTYYNAMNSLALQIGRAFALDLGMPPHFFAAYCDQSQTSLRLLRYPPQPADVDRTLFGAGAHSDWGIFTLLAQDGGGGLEIARHDGQWAAVEPVPDSFICNVGDCLMRWSNDRYVSRPHRVVNRSSAPRYALAFYADPEPETVIACLPTCYDADYTSKYAPISYAEYAQERYKAAAVGASA